MAHKKYIVNLRDDERQQLLDLVKKGKVGARRITRAHILLLADEGKADEAIGEALHAGVATIERTRRKFVEGNLEAVLSEKPRPKRKTRLDGRGRALLVATACSAPPAGHARWTMQLLAERLVELDVVERISDETVRLELKKTNSNPGRKSNGAFRR